MLVFSYVSRAGQPDQCFVLYLGLLGLEELVHVFKVLLDPSNYLLPPACLHSVKSNETVNTGGQ